VRTGQSFAAPLVCLCLLASPAMAADLTGTEIKDLISGTTVYIETTAASATGAAGKGVIYNAADGSTLYKTPSGTMWHGTWTIKDNTNCANWKEKPGVRCVKYDKQGDTISIIDTTTGEVLAKIVKAAPGNAENLAP
jgi:hypothetical protein